MSESKVTATGDSGRVFALSATRAVRDMFDVGLLRCPTYNSEALRAERIVEDAIYSVRNDALGDFAWTVAAYMERSGSGSFSYQPDEIRKWRERVLAGLERVFGTNLRIIIDEAKTFGDTDGRHTGEPCEDERCCP